MSARDAASLLGIGIAIVFCLSLTRRTEAIAHFGVNLAKASFISILTFFFLVAERVREEDAWGWAIIVGFVFLLALPNRRRYIRQRDRRKAIARFELATGKKFNPRRHELDHAVSFSQGGNNSADNLRVLERKTNRAKGRKSVWWDVFAK